MSREIEFTGSLAIGNGEPCPFCITEDNRLTDDVFIASEDNDIMEHIMEEHPSELNKAIFSSPPPKPWLEQDFQLVVAKVSAVLKMLDEGYELVSHETFKESMHNIYSIMKDYFKGQDDES